MNRLAAETSPYLRQHADNPVDWRPWGDEAFEQARADDKPVFLSVGYSSCHWCHVMAHESFEDPATADVMNRLFVNVKVDREERPDVDSIYMEAVQAMTGRGGWPMSVWLAPDGRPFYGGTYFPNERRHGMPSFLEVCDAVSGAWQDRRDEVMEQADRLREALEHSTLDRGRSASGGLEPALLRAAYTNLAEQFDSEWGGFGSAPKFPQAMSLSFVARAAVRNHAPETREILRTSLDAMAAGGIHDHVGGGFSRYSVDNWWLVPHFEKMLYDQATLLRAYVHGHQITAEPRWLEVIDGIVTYVLRDLRHADGGFYSAEDADSEGAEGKFYVWTIDEIREIAGGDADEVIRYFGVTASGNFEGANILHAVDRTEPRPDAVRRALPLLFGVRERRVRPGLDDKVLTEWNALFTRALAEAAFALDRSDWMDAARSNARFLLTELRRADGRLMRSWQASADPVPGAGASGRARHLAYAADHAALLEALCTLAEVDSTAWIAEARTVADAMLHLFSDDDEPGLFTAGDDAESLIVRQKDVMDNATPAANSLAANGLIRLAALTGESRFAQPAIEILEGLGPLPAQHPTAFGHALEALERHLTTPLEVVVVGDAADARTTALERAVGSRLLPASVHLRADPGAGDELPLLTGRTQVAEPTAYVCEHYACRQPVTDPDELAAQLDAALAARSR